MTNKWAEVVGEVKGDKSKVCMLKTYTYGLLGAMIGVVTIATTVPLAFAATYYVDPTTGDDANSGTSKAAPWATIPGTRNLADTAWISPQWGSVTNTVSGKIQPGDTIYLKAGTTQTGGGIDICDTERCTGGDLNPGFYSNATAGNPIRIRIDPTWGSGNFTFDFSNMTQTPLDDGAPFMIRSDYVWVEGVSETGRIKLIECDVAGTFSMLALEGRRDDDGGLMSLADQVADGQAINWVEIDGTGSAGSISGLNAAWSDGWIVANTIIHDMPSSGNYGVVIGNLNDSPTTLGMFYRVSVYNNGEGGIESDASDGLKFVQVKSYKNGFAQGANDGRGLNTGGINGAALGSVSILDSEFWGNATYQIGNSACGETEGQNNLGPCTVDSDCGAGQTCSSKCKDAGHCSTKICTTNEGDSYCGDQLQVMVAHTIAHAEQNAGGGTGLYVYGGSHTIVRRSTFLAYKGNDPLKSGADYNPAQVTALRPIATCSQDSDCTPTKCNFASGKCTAPTHWDVESSIFWPDTGLNLSCYNGASTTDVLIESDYNIWAPSSGGSNSDTLTLLTAAGDCDPSDPRDHTQAIDWLGNNDLRGTSNRPQFKALNLAAYSGNTNDYVLLAGSPGVDAGDWYCRTTNSGVNATVINVDCDPAQFFYDSDDYPGTFVPDDGAYIGLGTGRACTVASFGRSATTNPSLGLPGTITCKNALTWSSGEGLSRHPIYGDAPDIGAFESPASVPMPPTLQSAEPIP